MISQSQIHPVSKEEVQLLKKKFNLTNFKTPDIKKQNLAAGVRGFVICSVLSPSECLDLIRTCEQIGYTFWDPREGAIKDFRDADTIECTHEEIANIIWERVKDLVEERVSIEPDDPYWQPDLKGTWIARGINPTLLFGRYKEDGHFAPHTDGSTIIDFNYRSMYTIIIYLNTCKKGGRTHLYSDEQLQDLQKHPTKGYIIGKPEYLLDSVSPICGNGLFFYHSMVHEGEPIGEDSEKYFIRTDVMYEREIRICDKPEDREAFQMYEKAKQLTNEGSVEEAMKLFRRAFKLSRDLAEVYQM